MRTFLIILILFVGYSCQTNYYLSKPIKGIPPVALLESLTTNGILLATDYNLNVDTADFEECLQGLKLQIKAKSKIKIIDDLSFHKCPNVSNLEELKAKYDVDGLLLLSKIDVEKQCYDLPSKRLYLFPASHGANPQPLHYGTIPWTNIYVKIISQWEYHDFASGKSYLFSVKNDKLIELEEHVEDKDAYLDANYSLVSSLLYSNGSMTAFNLLEPLEGD